ncbi:Uncharacterized protein APZ42_012334 [Daphnia magna]|uniref:Uncharacterized protein n=1 Tax=Daphnia magna TaxID=35525 RepID=A0A162RYV0_9CRUS|nr:Uncharacterized protein APZ42_012334 [Daphnia magna]
MTPHAPKLMQPRVCHSSQKKKRQLRTQNYFMLLDARNAIDKSLCAIGMGSNNRKCIYKAENLPSVNNSRSFLSINSDLAHPSLEGKMEDIDYSYVNGSPEGELPPPSPIQQLQPQQPVHDDWGLGEQLQPQQPAHDDWGLGEQLQPQQPAHDDWEAGPQQPQQQPQQPPALLVEHAPVVRPDNFNRQRGNGWFRGQRRHSDLLRARTARLANRLHAEILAGRWRATVDTLKNILDLDPDNRHPPLYGWSASAWDDVYHRARRDW